MMIRSAASTLFLIATGALASVQVQQNFLSPEQVQAFRSVKIDEEPDYLGRFHSDVNLPAFLVNRIRGDASGAACEAQGEEAVVEVKTTFLTHSTAPHQDHYTRETGETYGAVYDEKVGFVFLNTNPGAAFVHGSESIPVEEGTLVTFPGTVTHNTVLKSGHVHLLGPFTMESFASNVGGGIPFAPTPAPTETPVREYVDNIWQRFLDFIFAFFKR